MMHSWKRISAALLLGWACGEACAATNFFAQASATETNVYLGHVFNVDVIVKAPERPVPPVDIRMEGFNVVVLNDGQEIRADSTYLFRYALRPLQAGKLSISSINFTTQGQSISTQPISINARMPQLTDRMTLRSMLSKTSCYVGEPVLFTTVWDSTYPFGALKAVDFQFPILSDKRFEVVDPYEPDKERKEQSTGLPVYGTRVLAERRSYQEGDVQHQTLSFDKILIPQTNGLLTLAPATLLCAAELEKDATSRRSRNSAFQYPSYFDNTFFDQNISGGDYARIYTMSQPMVLEVKPLPDEGRPPRFSGMVGEYALSVEAEPTAVRMGEPVTLTITVTSSGFMENIFLPPLRSQPNLVSLFDVPSERGMPLRRGDSKIYTQTIRPFLTTISNVPPLELSFFSPASNAYCVVYSESIPLTVSPADDIAVFGNGVNSSAWQQVDERFWSGKHISSVFARLRSKLLALMRPALFVLGVLLPLLAGGLWLASLYKKRKYAIRRAAKSARAFKVFRRSATHIARHHQTKKALYSELDKVLRVYLGNRLNLAPGALTFREVAKRLHDAGLRGEALDALKNLFLLCETYRFARVSDEKADALEVVQSACLVVHQVELGLKD